MIDDPYSVLGLTPDASDPTARWRRNNPRT